MRCAQRLSGYALAILIAACHAGEPPAAAPTAIPAATATSARVPGIFFNDFSYANQQGMIDHGWIICTAPGWPGVPNAVWGKNKVSLIDLEEFTDTVQRTIRRWCHRATF